MSLEAQMKELTAALDRNTAALTGKAPAKAAETSAAAPTEKKGPGRPAKPKITQDMVAEKANALKEAQGMPAVRALLKENGAADGKLASLPAEKYASVIEAIDKALEGDEGDEDGDDETI